MGVSRSTYYEPPNAALDDTAIVEAIAAICDEFEFYGWRRVRAELQHRGMIVNHEKIRRLMREHDLQPRWRRRYVATTDSDHDQPIYPNRTEDLTIDGPNQLWVADITYVAIVEGFAYFAVILDAWSRRAVGYAISRSIDVRLTLAALNAAIESRKPPPGCVHHSDSQRINAVSGRPDPHSDGPRLAAPRGTRCGLTRTPIDRPCLSPDLSSARERLAVGLCLADACDPRRA